MKKLFAFGLIIAALTTTFAPIAAANDDERPISIGADLDFASRYVWRGIYYSKGAVLEPTLWISKWGFTASAWGNIPLDNETDQGKLNEVDPTLVYEFNFLGLTIKPGFIYYLYPTRSSDPQTGELTLHLDYKLGPFSVFSNNFVDIDAFKGGYYGDVGAGFNFDFAAIFELQTSVSTAFASDKFNAAYFKQHKTALDNVALNLAINCQPFDFLFVRPHLQYFVLTNPALRNAWKDPNVFNVGVVIGAKY